MPATSISSGSVSPARDTPTVEIGTSTAETTDASTRVCSRCGAPVVSPDSLYCMRCGHPIDRPPLLDRIRRTLSKPIVVGGLAAVFVLLLVALIFAQGIGSPDSNRSEAGTGLASEAGGPLNTSFSTPTFTPEVTRPPVIEVPEVISVAKNMTPNATPRPLETVMSVRTLDRYIQDAGGDGDDLFSTPTSPFTFAPTPITPGPTGTVKTGPVGDLAWAGAGNYVTPSFLLDAGEVRLELAASELTMAQLIDANRTVLGLVTAGPNTGRTTILVPVPAVCRVEVWPFGTGLWTVQVTKIGPATPTTVPSSTVMPVPIPSSTTTEIPLPSPSPEASPIPTTLPQPTVTTTPNETVTPSPSQTLTTPPTQAPHTFTGNGTAVTPYFQLIPGVALFRYRYTGEGPFSVTLLDGSGTLVDRLVQVNGTVSGSKAVGITKMENYLLSIEAGGGWEISVG